MQPYNDFENDWISRVPLTPTGHIDVSALETMARRERARQLGALIARMIGAWKHRAQAARVRRDLDRAALGIGK